MEERVVRMRRTRKDEQNSPQSDSPSQSRSEKRRHGEDSALEQQNVSQYTVTWHDTCRPRKHEDALACLCPWIRQSDPH